MKKFILSFVALVFVNCSFAIEKTAYEEFLKRIESSKIYDESYYKDVEINGKSFSSFSKKERSVLIIINMKHFCNRLAYIYDDWEKEYKNAKAEYDDKKEATKQDIEQYMKELMKIRRTLAIKYEYIVQKLFKDYPKDFTEEEKNHIIKEMKEFNDKYHLIDRN